MGRPVQKFHRPGKRCRSGRWRLFWRGENRTYEFSVGDVSDNVAEQMRLELELALRGGEWPEWALEKPTVRRYRSEERGDGAVDVLGRYARHLYAEVSDRWAQNNVGYLMQWRDWLDGVLDEASVDDAYTWLGWVMENPGPRGKVRTAATRNRMLGACRKFYRWAVDAGYVDQNPFSDISTIKEDRPVDVEYLTRSERDRVLEVAREHPRGVSVWLALYTGMRRSEIWRLKWKDVSMDVGRITVQPGKTGKPRTVPIASTLLSELEERRPDGASGWVVRRKHYWTTDADNLLEHLEDACNGIENHLLRWNVFRHTFCTLLVQDGVAIDKVAAWSGHTPRVCRDHYAQFVPRDRHDEDIEKL